jgi:hypothetical protein
VPRRSYVLLARANLFGEQQRAPSDGHISRAAT